MCIIIWICHENHSAVQQKWTAESPEGETLNGSQSAVVGKHFGREKVVERDACYLILSLKVVYRCMWLFMVNPNLCALGHQTRTVTVMGRG